MLTMLCLHARLLSGTPFNTTLTNAAAASTLRIRTHNRTVLFETPLVPSAWHNFAVVVDWDNLTLQVFHSLNGDFLAAVTSVEDNSSVGKGPAAQGDFHFGLLKVRLSRFVLLPPPLAFVTQSFRPTYLGDLAPTDQRLQYACRAGRRGTFRDSGGYA
jgi:Glycoside hydrolase 131 catalytic N-terminal domain